MNTKEIIETMNTLAENFQKLGFKTIDQVQHTTTTGATGVYLVADNECNENRPKTPLHDQIWLRIYIENIPGVGLVPAIDFKAGPNFWLKVPGAVLNEEKEES